MEKKHNIQVNDEVTIEKIMLTATQCIANAIDIAMVSKLGVDWFSDFAKQEMNEKKPILRMSQTSILQCDFQALMKILHFRSNIRDILLEYFGVYNEKDEQKNQEESIAIDKIAERLMRFRNNIFHKRSCDSNSATDGSLTFYPAEQAVMDMLAITSPFREVKDQNGDSYFLHIEKMCEVWNRKQKTKIYSVRQTIKKEKLKIRKSRFIEICRELGISTSRDEGKNSFFYSYNYNDDINRIRVKVNETTIKKYRVRLTIFIFALLLIAVIAVLIVRNNSYFDDQDTNNGAEQTNSIKNVNYTVYENYTLPDFKNISGTRDTLYAEVRYAKWEMDESLTIQCYIYNGYEFEIGESSSFSLKFFIGEEMLTSVADSLKKNLGGEGFMVVDFNISADEIIHSYSDLNKIRVKCKEIHISKVHDQEQ